VTDLEPWRYSRDHDLRIKAMMLWFKGEPAVVIANRLGGEASRWLVVAEREGWVRQNTVNRRFDRPGEPAPFRAQTHHWAMT
jgi:hypothetical protein